MSTYKFTYFDGRGRGELARLIMTLGNIEFEDVRVRQEQWMEMKPKMLFGQLPGLEVDGKTLSESGAIYRFLAKRADLMGKSDIEYALIDMIVCKLDDLIKAYFSAMFAPADQRDSMKKKFQDEQVPEHLGKLEKYLEKGSSGFFVGDKISLADLAVFNALDAAQIYGVTYDAKKFPKIKALCDTVRSNERIAAYLSKRKPSMH